MRTHDFAFSIQLLLGESYCVDEIMCVCVCVRERERERERERLSNDNVNLEF